MTSGMSRAASCGPRQGTKAGGASDSEMRRKSVSGRYSAARSPNNPCGELGRDVDVVRGDGLMPKDLKIGDAVSFERKSAAEDYDRQDTNTNTKQCPISLPLCCTLPVMPQSARAFVSRYSRKPNEGLTMEIAPSVRPDGGPRLCSRLPLG